MVKSLMKGNSISPELYDAKILPEEIKDMLEDSDSVKSIVSDIYNIADEDIGDLFKSFCLLIHLIHSSYFQQILKYFCFCIL